MAAKIKRGIGEARQWEAEHGALSKTYCCEDDAHQSGGLELQLQHEDTCDHPADLCL